MTRFDQEDGKPYAECSIEGCTADLSTRELLDAHFKETANTIDGNRSHSARITNPTREERIRRSVESEASDAIDDALSRFLDDVYRLHEREGISIEELTEAVKRVYAEPDWADAWAEYLADA